MTVGFNTVFQKQCPVVFKVKNISSSNKTLRIFNLKIKKNEIKDLMSLPYVSEADIRHSLLKGELNVKIRSNDLVITESNIDLSQLNLHHRDFLINAGIVHGLNFNQNDYKELYVSQVLGSDYNSGDKNSPLKTLDTALNLAALSSTQTTIYLKSGTYNSRLWKKNIFKNPPSIIGLDWVYVSDILTLQSLSDDNYTFSSENMWETDEFESYVLLFYDGYSNYQKHHARTILKNSSNTIQLGRSHLNGNADLPVPGDRFVIALPAATIDITPEQKNIENNNQELVYTYYGGTNSQVFPVTDYEHFTRSDQSFKLRNLILEDKSPFHSYTAFEGSFWMDGVHFVKTTNYRLTVLLSAGSFFSGYIWNGDRPGTGDVNAVYSLYAWGLSFRNTFGGPRPVCHVRSAVFKGLVSGLGEMHAFSASVFMDRFSIHRDREFNYPHGVIGASAGSYVYCGGSRSFVSSGISQEPALHAEYHSQIEGMNGGNLHFNGVGSFVHCRTGSTCTLFNSPIIDGGNPSISAILGSYINLQGSNFAVLGTATAGIGPSLSRPAGPWVVGESINQQADATSAATLLATLPGDRSSIVRSS